MGQVKSKIKSAVCGLGDEAGSPDGRNSPTHRCDPSATSMLSTVVDRSKYHNDVAGAADEKSFSLSTGNARGNLESTQSTSTSALRSTSEQPVDDEFDSSSRLNLGERRASDDVPVTTSTDPATKESKDTATTAMTKSDALAAHRGDRPTSESLRLLHPATTGGDNHVAPIRYTRSLRHHAGHNRVR